MLTVREKESLSVKNIYLKKFEVQIYTKRKIPRWKCLQTVDIKVKALWILKLSSQLYVKFNAGAIFYVLICWYSAIQAQHNCYYRALIAFPGINFVYLKLPTLHSLKRAFKYGTTPREYRTWSVSLTALVITSSNFFC